MFDFQGKFVGEWIRMVDQSYRFEHVAFLLLSLPVNADARHPVPHSATDQHNSSSEPERTGCENTFLDGRGK